MRRIRQPAAVFPRRGVGVRLPVIHEREVRPRSAMKEAKR